MRAVKAVLTMLGILAALFLVALLLPAVAWLGIGAGVAILGCLLLPPAPVKS